MLPKFKFRAGEWIAREPIDWPGVGFWTTCGVFIGLTIVGLILELK